MDTAPEATQRTKGMERKMGDTTSAITLTPGATRKTKAIITEANQRTMGILPTTIAMDQRVMENTIIAMDRKVMETAIIIVMVAMVIVAMRMKRVSTEPIL